MDLLIAAAELIEKFENAGLDKIGKAEYLEMIEKGLLSLWLIIV